MGSSLACGYICQLSVYSTSFSLQVSGSYFLRLVGLPFEAELLQWNREDASWIALGQRVSGACWEIPTAADVVWETGAAAGHSFPGSAVPWCIQHSCSDLFAPNCFTAKGSHTLFQQELPFCLQTEPVRSKCPYRCISSQSVHQQQDFTSIHWANTTHLTLSQLNNS